MDSINDLKSDIIKTNIVVKENQKQLKEKIDSGWLDDADIELIDNDYYHQALINLDLDKRKEKIEPIKEEKNNFFKKFWCFLLSLV